MENTLIKELINKKLTIPETAKRLGISPSLWTAVKTGNRRVTADFVCRSMTAFPELTQLCLSVINSMYPKDEKGNINV